MDAEIIKTIPIDSLITKKGEYIWVYRLSDGFKSTWCPVNNGFDIIVNTLTAEGKTEEESLNSLSLLIHKKGERVRGNTVFS